MWEKPGRAGNVWQSTSSRPKAKVLLGESAALWTHRPPKTSHLCPPPRVPVIAAEHVQTRTSHKVYSSPCSWTSGVLFLSNSPALPSPTPRISLGPGALICFPV